MAGIGFGAFTKAIKPIMSSWKGANTGGLAVKGMAGGGAVGATYGGLSDNHTALGMGIAGAVVGGGIAREMNGLKAWQGSLNTRLARDDAKKVAQGYMPNPIKFSGADGAWKYVKNRFNTLGG